MKILLIAPWIRQGGAEIIAVKTALELSKLGHQIKLVCLFVDKSDMQIKNAKIEYISLGKLGNIFQKNKILLYFIGPLFLFYLTVKESKWPDILFPHSLPSYWIVSLTARFFNKKIVWLCNEPPFAKKMSETPFSDYLMWRIADSFLDRLFTKNINKTIVYSEIIKKEVKLRYKKEAKLIRLGIDFDFYKKRDAKVEDSLIKKYQLMDKKILLMVGKLHPQKNQNLAIDVLAKLLKNRKDMVLVLTGEGQDEKKLKAKAKGLSLEKNVFFVGFCRPETVRAWYGICHLILFPSVNQTAVASQSWGFIPFEALCQKKLSIVSERSGAAEILGKEKIGIVCRPEVEDFYDQINKFFKAKNEKEMTEKGFNYVRNNMRWEKWGKGIEEVLNDL